VSAAHAIAAAQVDAGRGSADVVAVGMADHHQVDVGGKPVRLTSVEFKLLSMLMRRHPEGLSTPPPVAIAHHIIRAWVENEIGID